MQLRRTWRGGFLRIHNRRERIVVNVNQVQRVVRLILGLGDNNCDGIAYVANGIRGEGAIR
jgi:hypothetical protein